MIDILRDPAWQFVGVVLALLTVAVSTYQFTKYRSKRSISCEIKSYLPLVTVSEDAAADIMVAYKGKTVVDLFLISLEITNDGNQPITTTDFEVPITIQFGDNSAILSAEIIDVKPKEMKPELLLGVDRVTLHPLLLNVGDLISIKFLVSSPDTQKNIVQGRVVGVNSITNTPKKEQKPILTSPLTQWLAVLISFFIMLLMIPDDENYSAMVGGVFIYLTILALVSLLWTIGTAPGKGKK